MVVEMVAGVEAVSVAESMMKQVVETAKERDCRERDSPGRLCKRQSS